MKKFYVFLIALIATGSSMAQCVIDTTHLPLATGGIYPSAQHLHHIVRDSLYDQTIQVRIPDTTSMSFGGVITVDVRIDSVRLDSLAGMPAGISWTANPAVLKGGHFGCGEFNGTTSDTAGTYRLTPIGMAWVHLTAPLLGLDKDTFQYGPLDRFPAFRNYSVVVDSAQLPLSVTTNVVNLCTATPNGSINAHANGGSPLAAYTYLWNTGSTTYFLNNLDSGSYSLTVTSGTETVTTTVNVIRDSPILLTRGSDSSTNGSNGLAFVTATGGTPPYRYNWAGNGNTDTITGLAPGAYRVTVRDSFNCVARDTVIVPGVLTGLSSPGNEIPKLSLFPNPAHNSMTVSIEAAGSLSGRMEAMDLAGRVVYSAPIAVNAGRYSRTVNTEPFEAGVYILQISSQGKQVQQRFVVSH